MRRSDRTRNGDLKTAILAEARRILVDRGYPDLTMRRIAGAIGVTPTSIYLHFQSKDALLHTLISEGLETLRGALEEAVRGLEDPAERLERLCRAYLAFGLGHPEWYEIMFLLHPPHMARFPAEHYRRGRRSLEIFAETLRVARGESDEPQEPGQAARTAWRDATAAWSTLHGAVALLIARRVDARLDRQAFLDAVVHQATQTLRPERARNGSAGAGSNKR